MLQLVDPTTNATSLWSEAFFIDAVGNLVVKTRGSASETPYLARVEVQTTATNINRVVSEF